MILAEIHDHCLCSFTMNRRNFIKGTTIASGAMSFPNIIPARLLGKNSPSNKITVGMIGTGNHGIHRNLNMFSRRGKILEFFVDNVGHYCGGETNHLHLACVKCNEVKDSSFIGSELVADIQSRNFAPLFPGFVIKGICKDCQCLKTSKV